MLKIYLSSVIIWFFILTASVTACGKYARKNGWLTNRKDGEKSSAGEGIVLGVTTACLPIFRFLIVAVLFYMAVFKKEG